MCSDVSRQPYLCVYSQMGVLMWASLLVMVIDWELNEEDEEYDEEKEDTPMTEREEIAEIIIETDLDLGISWVFCNKQGSIFAS